MAVYVAPKHAFFSINGDFTDVQATHALYINTPL